MPFEVRINGEILRPMSRADIEKRGPNWLRAGVTAEVREQGSNAFLSLAQFLAAPAQPVSSAPAPLTPATARDGSYLVRIDGQIIGPMERADLERRAVGWQHAGVHFEVAENGTSNFTSLYGVLARAQAANSAAASAVAAMAPRTPATAPQSPPPPAQPRTPAVPPFGPGPYWVRVGGQLLGPLTRDQVESRSQRWQAATIEVAERTGGPYVDLADFRRMPVQSVAPTPQPGLLTNVPHGPGGPRVVPKAPGTPLAPVIPIRHPAVAAALTLVTLNLYWLYWLANTYKRIRQLNPNATTITPGKAVGFLFIPVFGPLWFVWLVFSLPRSIVRVRGTAVSAYGFACSVAGVMFLVGSLWIYGLAFPPLPAKIAWIVGCEALLLGYIAFCQALLNSAAYAAIGAPALDRPGRVMASSLGLAAITAALGVYFTFFAGLRDVTPYLDRAHQFAASGNFEAAAQELQRADAPATKYELAFLYKNGLGVKQDTSQAVALLREAADAGMSNAQTTLGLWYATGDGVTASPATAIDWYRKAAAQGENNGAILLGLAYAAGNGVEQDPEKAYMWFTVAASRGDAYAASEKTVAGNVLTSPAQRERAEKEAAAEAQREEGGQR